MTEIERLIREREHVDRRIGELVEAMVRAARRAGVWVPEGTDTHEVDEVAFLPEQGGVRVGVCFSWGGCDFTRRVCEIPAETLMKGADAVEAWFRAWAPHPHRPWDCPGD